LNLIPLDSEDLNKGLIASDYRIRHVQDILRGPEKLLQIGLMEEHEIALGYFRSQGERFVVEITERWPDSPPLGKTTLCIGAVRPPTTERLLRDLTALGVRELIFFASDLSEKSYLSSKIWQEENLCKNLWLGAAQGKTTHLPRVKLVPAFHKIFPLIQGMNPASIGYLDFTPDSQPLGGVPEDLRALILGPERGFSPKERSRLAQEYLPYSLGPRVLRTETAALIGAHHLLNKV
jgi:16S rRNA (uracil1498-N3)-methyltransferase